MQRVRRHLWTGEFLGKAALAVLFSVLTILKLMSLNTRLLTWRQTEGIGKYVGVSADIASLLFLGLLLVVTLTRLQPSRTAEGWEPRISAIIGSFLSFALIAFAPADFGPVWQATGVFLIAVGTVLSILVLSRLGRSFSVVPQARRLVTTGPYAMVRHPLYLCEEIAMIGIVMIHFSLAAVAILVVQWMFQLRRMANEERLLSATYAEYAAYAARTPRVIPHVYRQTEKGLEQRFAKSA